MDIDEYMNVYYTLSNLKVPIPLNTLSGICLCMSERVNVAYLTAIN